MKIAAYVRVSTVTQKENEAPEHQLARIKSYIAYKYPDYRFEDVLIYQDVESGRYDDRKDYQRLLNDMKEKKFNILIVTEFQRVSRKLITLLNFIVQLAEDNIVFISLVQSFDTSNSMGRAMIKIIGVFAELEREQTAERVTLTFNELAKEGKRYSKVSFGYRKKDKDTFEIIEEEAEIVKKIFDDFRAGESRGNIASKYGMNRDTVHRILTNDFYAGIITYGKKRINPITFKKEKKDDYIIAPGTHEAIIDKETFDWVQNRLKQLYQKKVKTIDNPNVVLANLAKCYCGHTMYAKYSGNSQNIQHYYYSCANRQCNKRSIRAEELENSVIEKILELKENPSFLDDSSFVTTNEENKLEDLKKKEKKKLSLLDSESRLVDLYLSKSISVEAISKKSEELKNEIIKLDTEIAILKETIQNDTAKIINRDYFFEVVKDLNVNDKGELRKILQILIAEIRFHNDFEYEIIYNI